ncbi:conserved membrane hypothetical protein [Candidatus Zixiibacteriota bacterium]|nr:conserved membrane hypothetical protein [candidate division Zixibacteria bacterium]
MNKIGLIISLAVIAAGLLYLFILSIRGRDVERRFIFLFMGVAVAVPILFNISFSEKATPIVKAAFDKIENLPSGSKILISYDYDPAMAPEVNPMTDAFVRHAMAKGHRIYFMNLWATGQPMVATAIDQIIKKEFPEKKYGVDYVNLGYKAGGTGVLNVIITDIRKMYLTDVNGANLDSLPIMNGIRSLRDMDLLISVGGGLPGVKEWVLFAGDPGHIPVVGGCAAVSAPLLYPYYPNQLIGLLGGIKGAAEYESELKRKYPRFAETPQPGIKMMGPQTMAHLVIMAFIIFGNISFFVLKSKGEGK